MQSSVLSALMVCGVFVSGCRDDQPTTRPAPSPAANAAPKPSTSAREVWPVPVGPRMAILPGKGIGAVRFGANRETIQRLMEFPCEVNTTTLCGYNGRAVDFILTNGLVEEIRIQRSFRKNLHLPQATYGVFNGQFLDGTHLEMLRPTVLELAGAPQSVEMITAANPWNTVERDHYESAIFEYDRTASGNIVLGGVILKNPATAQPAGSAQPIASAQPAPSAVATPSARPAPSAHKP